ncbi:MAG: hypothetical protein KC656_35640, partial [Myxococcales bacterium]|nr:hypothetical protein [Myxococcales bacterium]
DDHGEIAGGAFVMGAWDDDGDGAFGAGDRLIGSVDGLMLYLFDPIPDTLAAVGALPGWNVSRFSGYPSPVETALPLTSDMPLVDLRLDMTPTPAPRVRAVLQPDPELAAVAVDVFHLGATVGLEAPEDPTLRQVLVRPAGENHPFRIEPPWPVPPEDHVSVLGQTLPDGLDPVAQEVARVGELEVSLYELRAYADDDENGRWTASEVVYGESFDTGEEPMLLHVRARTLNDAFLVRRLGLTVGWSLAGLVEGRLTTAPWDDGLTVLPSQR